MNELNEALMHLEKAHFFLKDVEDEERREELYHYIELAHGLIQNALIKDWNNEQP